MPPIKDKLNNIWSSLSRVQKLYFSALLALIFWALFGNTEHFFFLFLSGALGLVALAIEVLPRFTWLWNSLFGKGLLLIIYAVVANFALVFSNQIINQVVGIDPSELFYTQSITALLTAPLWIMIVSLFLMLIYLLLLNVTLLSLALLRLFKLNLEQFAQREAFPLTTILVRLIIAPVIIFTLGNMMTLYSDDIFKISDSDASPNSAQSDSNTLDRQSTQGGNLNFSSTRTDSVVFRHFIAGFVYHLETFPLSQCKKSEMEHIKFIGDDDILVASIDSTSDLGYRFSVRKCELQSHKTDDGQNP